MKFVNETSAGKAISAYIVTDKKGQQVAKIQIYHGSTVFVNIWAKMGKNEPPQDNGGNWYPVQYGRAGGYGYDKKTAALSGLKICGITLRNHCGTDKKTESILKAYLSNKISFEVAKARAAKIGADFANWDSELQKYRSLYYRSGLQILESYGYRIYQAI